MRNEIAIRLIFFFSIFVIIAFWELLAPRRPLTTSKKLRWLNNLGITFLNPLMVRLIFPILAVNMALRAQERDWDLLNNFGFNLPWWDRLFGIYCDQPTKGHTTTMTIGLSQFRNEKN